MRLIVDTGRIVAALVRDSTTRSIILSDKFELLTVSFLKSEITEHEQELAEKAKLKKSEFNEILSKLMSHVQIISDLTIESKMNEARKIMQDIDPDDMPFIAAALAVEFNGIWADDDHFRRQTQVKIFGTATLLRSLSEYENQNNKK